MAGHQEAENPGQGHATGIPVIASIGGDVAVHIAPMSEFVSLLPDSFSVVVQATNQPRASISPCQPDSLMVCMESNMLTAHRLVFPENRGRVLMSRTVNQLNGLASQLISRNLLMVVRVIYQVKSGDKWEPRVEHLAVLVNTKHPSIRPQIEAGLEGALRSLSHGALYALELNFNGLICTWLKRVLALDHIRWKSSKRCEPFVTCEGDNLVITNCTEYSRLFNVRSRYCCCLWLFCCPCCCIACPAYAVTRYMKVDDHRVKITGDVRYWDLRNLSPQMEDLVGLRRTLTGERFDWNQVFGQLQARCEQERRQRESPASYAAAVTSQPATCDTDGLPSYEEAILRSGVTDQNTDGSVSGRIS